VVGISINQMIFDTNNYINHKSMTTK